MLTSAVQHPCRQMSNASGLCNRLCLGLCKVFSDDDYILQRVIIQSSCFIFWGVLFLVAAILEHKTMLIIVGFVGFVCTISVCLPKKKDDIELVMEKCKGSSPREE